jgi:hypothetical protein
MRLVLAFLALLFPGVLVAETSITVRAGDHQDFTRITFSTEPELEWVSEGRALSFLAEDVVFDTTSLFSRIARSRLHRLDVDGAKVTFILACDCDVSTFQAAPDLVAADIRGVGAKINDRDAQEIQHSLTLPLLSITGQFDQDASARPNPAIVLDETRSVSANHQATVGSDNIVWSISRAATLGLIDPLQSTDKVSENHPFEPVEIGTRWQAHARISTDRPHAKDRSQEQDTTCPAAETLPQLSESKAATHAQLIAALTDDVGRLKVDRVIDLIDFYISRAHGAEATSLIPLVEDGEVDLDVRKAIAHLLDKVSDESSQAFTPDFLVCDPNTALWAFVFLHKETQSDALDYKALIDEFLTWPEALKFRFAPDLIDAMLDRNRSDLARILVRLSDSKHLGNQNLLNSARMADIADRASQQTEFFGQIFSGHPMGLPESLAQQIGYALKAEHKFTLDELERGVALLPEYKGMNGEAEFRMALSSAFIQIGNFSAAYDLWEPEGGSQPIEQLFWQALEHIAFEEFAWAALAILDTDSGHFSEELNKRLSDELIRIGFLSQHINRQSTENEGSRKHSDAQDGDLVFEAPITAALAEVIANNASVAALDVEDLLHLTSEEN